MSFEEILGQTHIKEFFEKVLQHQKVFHAYIFHGPVGTGKKKMAQLLAKRLLCIQKNNCGECVSCRKVQNHNHENITYIEPDGKSIKIEQIRQLQRSYAYKGLTGEPRFYIIEQAETLTLPAANSLLKFLEEPNAGTIAIFLVENKASLLPTIISRSQTLEFFRVPSSQLEKTEALAQYPELLRKTAAHFSNDIKQCEEIITSSWFAEMRKLVVQLLRESLRDVSYALILVQQRISEIQDVSQEFFNLFILLIQDLIYIQIRYTKNFVFTDHLPLLEELTVRKTVSEWIDVMEHAMQAKKQITSYANAQLAVERFLIKLRGG